MTGNEILNALREAYQRAGTQTALAQLAGVSQGRIADYLNGRCSIGNMSVATLLKIFPDIKIDFFGEKTGNDESDLRRAMYLEIFDGLSAEDQMRCLAMASSSRAQNRETIFSSNGHHTFLLCHRILYSISRKKV